MLRAKETGDQFRLELVYVDGFAGWGRYERDSDDPDGPPVSGSPIIAIRALEEATDRFTTQGIDVRLTAILVEKGDKEVNELLENLALADLSIPIERVDGFATAGKGKVNVIRGDFRDHIDDILSGLDENDFLLAFIDPLGPTMPLASLGRLLGRNKTDAITLFPTLDIEIRGGSVNKSEALRTTTEKRNLERSTRHFGSAEWMEIARHTDLSRPERETMFVDLYHRQLQTIDPELVVKNISLRLSGIDRAAYSIFLTTRDAFGAFRMNDILREGRFREHWTLWSDREERLRERGEGSGILELDLGVPRTNPPQVEIAIPAVEEVGESVLEAIRPGQAIRYKELLGRLANLPYRASEINKTLRRLKKDGALDFDRLTKDGLIRRAE